MAVGPLAGSPAATAYEGTPPPELSTPWREAAFCVVDLETTGLDAQLDEIVSFAAVQVAGGRVRLADVRYRLVRPQRMPEGETIRIHGLRAADLTAAPTLGEVLDELLEALTGKVLVAHVASVETRFLDAALRTGQVRLVNPVIDTDVLGKELLRRRGQAVEETLQLSYLARTLGLPIHRPHHADGDALTTAQVFLALATHLDRQDPQTVGSLCKGAPAPTWRARATRLARRLAPWKS